MAVVKEMLDMNKLNTVYRGDAFELLSVLANDSIDLVLTSPPYYDARNYGGEVLFDDPDEWQKWCLHLIVRLSNKIKPSGVIWWNTGSGYRDHGKMTQVYGLVDALNHLGIRLIDEIPWIKKSGPPKKIKNRPPPMWEHNYIFAKSPEQVQMYHDQVLRPYAKSTLERMKYEVSNLSGDKDGEYNKRKKVEPNPKGAMPVNYLMEAQDTTARPHPAPMQPKIANWAIRAYTKEGDIVLDPMMGAGTTAVESERLKRRWLGFELYDEYVNLTRLSLQRFRQGKDPYRGLKKAWEKENERN
jgi:DNA modification methylase